MTTRLSTAVNRPSELTAMKKPVKNNKAAETFKGVRAEKKAAEQKREVTVVERVAEEAFEALLAGNTGQHDEILKRTIVGLANEVDVVVLAQVSLARLVPSLGATRVPVLSSQQSGVASLKDALSRAR